MSANLVKEPTLKGQGYESIIEGTQLFSSMIS